MFGKNYPKKYIENFLDFFLINFENKFDQLHLFTQLIESAICKEIFFDQKSQNFNFLSTSQSRC